MGNGSICLVDSLALRDLSLRHLGMFENT